MDTKLGEDQARQRLIDEAWRLCAEVLDAGTLTLKSGGAAKQVSPKDILRHAQWLASMTKRHTGSMPVPKDLYLHKTG
jgi:hypothetical protein